MDSEDRALWARLVEAEKVASRCRAELHCSDSRLELLERALAVTASPLDQGSAFQYLLTFRSDIGNFIEILFVHALGDRWQSVARQLLQYGFREKVVAEVRRLVAVRLPAEDGYVYVQTASLAAALGDTALLRSVIDDALGSVDLEIREAGMLLREAYEI